MNKSSRIALSQSPTKKTHRLRLEPLEPRHLLAGVVINELHYDPDNSLERVEFVELHNATDLSVDISGWRIDEGVDYQFPPGSVIDARGYVVIAQNSDDFQAKFGFAPFGEWEDGDRLKNSGERVELLDADGTEIDELRFRLGFPWPTPANGESIELINPNLENDEGGAWRSSLADSSIIQENSVWRYRKGITNNPPAGWNDVGFNESADNVTWQDGTTTIGYGDGDDTTLLSDMRNGYTSVYFRKDFELGSAIPGSLNLRLYVDDGAIIYLNGTEVDRAHVSAGTKNYNSTSGVSHEASWEDITLTGLSNILQSGTNTIAIHGLNQNSNSSDFSFNAALQSSGTTVSPGAQNSAYADNAPPLIEDVEHSPKQPGSDEEVVITAKIEDDQGVATATLEYQLVAPGDYIEIGDPRYATNWTAIAMRNDGLGNDEEADDRTFTVTLPASLQEHRQLVRYRIVATDSLGDTVQIPYADDPQPNFAYFVYDQTPDWTGAVRPGVTQAETYSGELLDSVATYHLITTRQDHEDAQHIPNSPTSSYGGSEYRWHGALVYDGEVYDHVRYRARGGVWRYSMGKNMWKFDFNRGHDFFAKDNYGNEYEVGWDKLNLGANIQQGDFWHRGEQGMFESVGFKLFNLAGVEAPNTNHVHFRIIESADENGADQYSSDFQGMYLAIEQMDGQFLEQHGLPDGNLYKMENGTGVGGIGGDLNNQGDWPEPQDSSDLIEFKQTYESGAQSAEWWKANFNLDSYYSYRMIVEGIHHYDIANGKNYFYYHNPETDKWETLPWDLDLTWANNMFGSGNEPFRTRVLAIPEFAQGYRNRVRELRDLLYNDDQAYAVIDEMASFVNTPGEQSLVDADRAMWDYNPILVSSYVRSSKAGHGRFYAGGGGVPATNSFEGMLNKMKTYIQSRINLFDNSILNDDAQLPDKPILFTTTPSTYPVDLLGFATNAYSDPQNDAFAAMEYRIGEVANPGISTFTDGDEWKYEIDAVWETGELTTYTNSIQVD
ncbi:MAG: CotH kinase family protein, partial [Planctomycetota bacterium]